MERLQKYFKFKLYLYKQTYKQTDKQIVLVLEMTPQEVGLEICPKILFNNWSKLIRIWSLVLDRHIFQISALYLNFEGAKNIQLDTGL